MFVEIVGRAPKNAIPRDDRVDQLADRPERGVEDPAAGNSDVAGDGRALDLVDRAVVEDAALPSLLVVFPEMVELTIVPMVP